MRDETTRTAGLDLFRAKLRGARKPLEKSGDMALTSLLSVYSRIDLPSTLVVPEFSREFSFQ
jgi:hypothetical protein